ncbi:unnamed protein product [Caenorhabditis bovis]|uniref:Uncharacterized protein n=1 Tax=Caenorhabditis bovis TaxID=2654633 RepID=A0A8S1F6T3_9PELO|nr:unnamed protein product [Caenorhabditis bovis]
MGFTSILSFILNTTIFELLIYWIIFAIAYKALRKYLDSFVIDNLSRRPVFITGCDTGFGRALALKCLENGMPVFAGCLTEQGIKSLRAEARNLKGTLDALQVNVGNEESVARAGKYLEEKVEKYGGLHAVVNNAGITGMHIADDFLSIDDYYKCCEINLFGVMRSTKHVLKLVKRAKGRVVTVASICARVGIPGLGPYTVSKYAVSGYCDVLRHEMRPFGVTVHILEPGFFKTPLVQREKLQKEFEEAFENGPADIKAEYGEKYFQEISGTSHSLIDKFASDNINLVVDAYFHAITSKYPKSRYQVGWDSVFVFIPFSYLPTGVQDAFFTIIGSFTPKPAACAKN